MVALSTPRLTASTQQSIFGIIPPAIIPSFLSFITSLTFTAGIKVLSSFLSLKRPLMSVIKIKFFALIAPAMAPAARSAFMLYTSPLSPPAILEIIGIYPPFSAFSIMLVFTS